MELKNGLVNNELFGFTLDYFAVRCICRWRRPNGGRRRAVDPPQCTSDSRISRSTCVCSIWNAQSAHNWRRNGCPHS